MVRNVFISVPCKRPKEWPRPLKEKLGKPLINIEQPLNSHTYVYEKYTLQKTPQRLGPLKVKLGKTPINIG